jgi:GNAT superfamily N-acetyltransferase
MIPIITLTDVAEPYIESAVSKGLDRFNNESVGSTYDYRPLVLGLTHPDTTETIGGLWADTGWGQLHVRMLFVPKTLRGTGIGSVLMSRAEEEALQRGCHAAWLDTFSFQACAFYENLGYAVFGVIDNYPPGHSRFFLKKALLPKISMQS